MNQCDLLPWHQQQFGQEPSHRLVRLTLFWSCRNTDLQ